MSLYIFDKDGTLVQRLRKYWLFKHSPLKMEEQILIPGVFEKLAELRAAGHQLAIATNQPAVARGLISLQEAEELVKNCAAKVGGVDAWRLSPFHPLALKTLHGKPNPYARDDDTHKPHPGMILDLMRELHSVPTDTFMIGDKRVDKKCAHAAGATFIAYDEFFNV